MQELLKSIIKEVPDFPKPGISFKDITPILERVDLHAQIIESLALQFQETQIDYVAGIESRGFLFGMGLAQYLKVPFIPIRKVGKLPRATFQQSYDLEYGSATLEIHQESIFSGAKVLIHDDLMATSGTALATAKLLAQAKAHVAGFSFIIELEFLDAREKLAHLAKVDSLVSY